MRRGYLPAIVSRQRRDAATKASSRTSSKAQGDDVSLTGTVKASGLGGEPYRDGTYAYYIGEKVVTNDPKGVGAFLLASTEMENAPESNLGSRQNRRRRRLVQLATAH